MVRRGHPTDAGPLAAVGPAVATCIAWDYSPEQVAAADDAAWAEELPDLIAGGLANVAVRALKHLRADPDPAVLSPLRDAATAETLRSLNVEAHSGAALRRLARAGLRPVVIKGPAVARYYPQSTDRAFADLDLVVDPQSFATAKGILERSNFRVPLEAEQPWPYFDRFCREGVNLHGTTDANIDIHHHIPPWRFSRLLSYSAVARNASNLLLCGEVVRGASADHSLVIAGLHVLNDLWKGAKTFRSWRDLLVLSARIGPAAARDAFLAADLLWLMDLLFEQLAIVSAQKAPVGDPRSRSVLREARLHALGWGGNGIVARHRVGWGLRLPAPHTAMFVLGSLVPSPSYIRRQRGSYPAYWHTVGGGVWETLRGADYRYVAKRVQKKVTVP